MNTVIYSDSPCMWSIEIMAVFCRVYCVHINRQMFRSKDLKQELPERLNTALDMPAKPSGGMHDKDCVFTGQ